MATVTAWTPCILGFPFPSKNHSAEAKDETLLKDGHFDDFVADPLLSQTGKYERFRYVSFKLKGFNFAWKFFSCFAKFLAHFLLLHLSMSTVYV